MRSTPAHPLLSLVLALAPAACRPEQPQRAPEGAVLTIGYSRLRISLPIFVAEQEGIFAKHGIKPKLVMYDTAQPLMQAMVEGRLDAGGYTALPITYSGMLRSGAKLLFLTALVEDQEHRISYLLRAKTAPGAVPEITTVADLRGKTIGILPTVAYKAWLTAILKDAGVEPTEVTIQNIEPQLAAQTLAAKGVDALFTNDPAATAAIASGVAELITDSVETPKVLGEPFLFGSFNVRKEWADAHQDELRRLSAALDEAVELVNREPLRAKKTMARYLPETFRPHVELYPDARYLPSTKVGEADFAKMAESYHRLGIIEQPLPLAGLVLTSSRAR